MPKCEKCRMDEATVHLSMDVDGVRKDEQHLCNDCWEEMELLGFDPAEFENVSVAGKHCSFCGTDAASLTKDAGETFYFCEQCHPEYQVILAELLQCELQDSPFPESDRDGILSFMWDPEKVAWIRATLVKARQTLRDRKSREGESG